jgi:hypothetical protein
LLVPESPARSGALPPGSRSGLFVGGRLGAARTLRASVRRSETSLSEANVLTEPRRDLTGWGFAGEGGGRQRARVAGVACVTGIVAMIGAARGRFGAGEDLGAHLRRGGDARGRPAGGDARDGRDDAEGGDGGGGHFERARLV